MNRMEDYMLERLRAHAAGLGLAAPRLSVHEGKPLMISALPTGPGERARPSAENPVGSLAAFAQKNFYREMAHRLAGLLRLLWKDGLLPEKAGCRIFCNSRLPEKELAVRAGLGAQGKNSLVILPGAGSLFVLGGIVFPAGLPCLEKSEAAPARTGGPCGDCDACLRACPVGAISGNTGVDRRLCIQAYTAEERPVPPEVREKWGITLYGCPVCQEVCPHNKKAPPAADTARGLLGPAIALEKILACPEAELRKTLFRGSALDMAWISPLALKRNALLAAAHQKAKKLLPLLARYERHPNPLLRETAAWAAARILGR
jgi:epoxyqueuosine reductase